MLVYSAFLLHRYAQSVHASNERRVLEIARALNSDVDREIIAIITTLETLATSRSLEYEDFADFYAQAKEALRSRPWHVVLIDAKGQQRVNTRLRWGAPLPHSAVTEPDLPRIARESQQPYVTDLFRGTVAERPIFAVSVPVRRGKQIPYALVMSLEPDRLVEILTGESQPSGWLAAVADRKNINMARTRLASETSSPSAVVSLSPDGIIRTWNAAATSVFGYDASEAIGQPVHILCPEGADEAFDKLYASVPSGTIVHADVVRRHEDGRLIDVSANIAPMYDEAGQLVGISSINRDIAERKARERHIEFLMRELAHRSKNLLAVVQAIAGQTVRYSPSLEEFQARFSQRISAMARTQDLLVGRDWQGASMPELVRAQLAPFAEKAHSRIEVSGPELELKPNVVHSITLALHELATNAAKYGALSVPDGRVAIAWEPAGSEAQEGRSRMSGRETTGPPVAPPVKKGFGHVVISEMVASSLRGEVTLDYAPGGLVWSIDMPASSVLRDA